MSVDQNASYIMETVLTVCDNPIVYSLPQKKMKMKIIIEKKRGYAGRKDEGKKGGLTNRPLAPSIPRN